MLQKELVVRCLTNVILFVMLVENVILLYFIKPIFVKVNELKTERVIRMVWVVVNTKIPVVQVFEHEDKARQLFQKLIDIDREKYGNAGYTLFVERTVNPLTIGGNGSS